MIQIFVLFSFLAWTIALLGLGTPIRILLGKIFQDIEFIDEIRFLFQGILGLIVVSVLGTIFNFFIPLDSAFSLTVLLIGITLFCVYRKNIIIAANRLDTLISGIILLIGSLFSLLDLKDYDTGLYHLPMINWITHSALPFGLANLHERLGTNSSWFIDAAVVYPLRFVTQSPFFIINAILFSFYGTFIFLTLMEMLKNGTAKFSSFFTLSTVIPWLYCLASFISSPSPDNPTMLITLLVTFLLIRTFETMNIDYLFITFLISFYGFTIKLSAASYFVSITCILFAALTLKILNIHLINEHIKTINMSKYTATSIIIFLIGFPHFIRGIIASGYVSFPLTLGFPNLYWSVPLKEVVHVQDLIKGWARSAGPHWHETLNSWSWLASWAHHLKARRVALWLGMVIAGLALDGLCFIRKRTRDLRVFLAMCLLSLMGCVFWFLTAPTLRFGYGYLYSLSGILLSYGLYNLLTDKKNCQFFLRITLVLFIALCIFQHRLHFDQMLNVHKVKKIRLVKHKSINGVTLFTPKNGDQCFDAPLLCTPYFKKNLHVVLQGNRVTMFSVK